jgi:hypothetical protein
MRRTVRLPEAEEAIFVSNSSRFFAARFDAAALVAAFLEGAFFAAAFAVFFAGGFVVMAGSTEGSAESCRSGECRAR